MDILIGLLIGIVIGIVVAIKLTCDLCDKIIKQKNKKIERLDQYYVILRKWLSTNQNGIDLSNYFKNNSYKKVAIYGLGELGRCLVDEISKDNIIVCGIDKDISDMNYDFDLYKADDVDKIEQKIDVVVVTAISYFSSVKAMLQNSLDCDIVSLQDIINDCSI